MIESSNTLTVPVNTSAAKTLDHADLQWGSVSFCTKCISPIKISAKHIKNKRFLCDECWRKDRHDWWLRYKAKPDFQRKRKAQVRLRSLVRSGTIKPMPCQICSRPKAVAHHPDYEKPANVVWLCQKCHQKYHARSGDPQSLRNMLAYRQKQLAGSLSIQHNWNHGF